jgi:hypothetical protein
VTQGTLDYLSQNQRERKTFLVWYGSTAMHHFPHVKQENLEERVVAVPFVPRAAG